MNTEVKERPVITEFMGDGFTLNKAHRQYLDNLELWNYVQALDAYCDELEKMQSKGNNADLESAKCNKHIVSNNEADLDCDYDITAKVPFKSKKRYKIKVISEVAVCPYCDTELENVSQDICMDCWNKHRNP